MSKCISGEGEYSDHELAEQPRFVCARCFVFDEDAALARVRELEATVEKVRAKHRRQDDDDEPYCGSCWASPYGYAPWPCPTIEAIGGDEENGDHERS